MRKIVVPAVVVLMVASGCAGLGGGDPVHEATTTGATGPGSGRSGGDDGDGAG